MTKRQRYFIKQKLLGVALLLLTVAAFFTECGIIGVFTIPLGLMLIFTKKMAIVDKYFLDENEVSEWDEEL